MAMVSSDKFKIIKGKNFLKLYQFHTKIAKHYFCSECGIYTHHNPRRDPSMFGFNVGCIEGFDIVNISNVKVIDGANHPLDKK
tara:strand:- start:649 stop:897 length:249 start_codon:yes stop_codon:yes gene_type:complete